MDRIATLLDDPEQLASQLASAGHQDAAATPDRPWRKLDDAAITSAAIAVSKLAGPRRDRDAVLDATAVVIGRGRAAVETRMSRMLAGHLRPAIIRDSGGAHVFYAARRNALRR